jgi:hypothetical protein
LPSSLIRILGALPVSTYPLYGAGSKYLGSANSYFVEIEVSAKKMLIEVVAYGEDVIVGRNLANELILELNGPAKVTRVKTLF